jgi:hypothetical protein
MTAAEVLLNHHLPGSTRKQWKKSKRKGQAYVANLQSSTQTAQTACIKLGLSPPVWIKVCFVLLQCHSRPCQCAYRLREDPAGYGPFFETIAERDLLALTMQASSHFGMCRSSAFIQCRSDQRIQEKLSAGESPSEGELGFGLSSFSWDCGGTAAP